MERNVVYKKATMRRPPECARYDPEASGHDSALGESRLEERYNVTKVTRHRITHVHDVPEK